MLSARAALTAISLPRIALTLFLSVLCDTEITAQFSNPSGIVKPLGAGLTAFVFVFFCSAAHAVNTNAITKHIDKTVIIIFSYVTSCMKYYQLPLNNIIT